MEKLELASSGMDQVNSGGLCQSAFRAPRKMARHKGSEIAKPSDQTLSSALFSIRSEIPRPDWESLVKICPGLILSHSQELFESSIRSTFAKVFRASFVLKPLAFKAAPSTTVAAEPGPCDRALSATFSRISGGT